MTEYEKALDYMKKAAERGSKLGLSRIEELLSLIGNPQDKIKIIHVSGTNGKGSFCAMLCSVLKNSGYKVGSFSSPAITKVNDSFRINCDEISDEEFASLINDIAPICESMDDKPTEFEVLTAAAFELFFRSNCDIAVVECGMGGDLDSTNMIGSPLLSVITNVQKDHCGFLGNTIEEIAAHKAGIIKHGRPVFFGGESDNIPQSIINAAKEKSAPLFTKNWSEIKYNFPESVFSLSGTSFNYKGMKINLPLLGTYQLGNAVNVLNCVEILRDEGLEIPYNAVKSGIENSKWHGRFEVLRKKPIVIFDGSHNPDGIKYAAESIELYFKDKKIALLIGVMADKEYELYADMLGGLIDQCFAVSPDNPRSLDSRILAESFVQKGIGSSAFENLEDGVKAAFDHAKNKDIPLIALGSLYMYREFIEALEKC